MWEHQLKRENQLKRKSLKQPDTKGHITYRGHGVKNCYISHRKQDRSGHNRRNSLKNKQAIGRVVQLSSVTQLCPTLCNPMGCSLPGSSVQGDSPGKNTGVGCHALLQGIFPTQGSNPGLPHCRQILYCPSHQGSPRILEWVAYLFSRRSSQPRNQTGVSCIAGGFFTSWATREAREREYLSSDYLGSTMPFCSKVMT